MVLMYMYEANKGEGMKPRGPTHIIILMTGEGGSPSNFLGLTFWPKAIFWGL